MYLCVGVECLYHVVVMYLCVRGIECLYQASLWLGVMYLCVRGIDLCVRGICVLVPVPG